MILNLLILVTVAVIAWGAYRNGLFGAVITFFAVFFSNVVAMSFYHYLSKNVLGEYFGAIEAYADAASFMGLFVVALFIFQVLARAYLPTELTFAKAFDAFGSLVVGLLSGLIVAGVMTIGFFMLPINESFVYGGENVFFNVDRMYVGQFERVSRQLGGKGFDGESFLNHYKERYTSPTSPPAPQGPRTPGTRRD